MTGFDSPDIGVQTSPGVTKTIPSRLYWQYSDDGDLQSLVDAYNQITQSYLDWFNVVDLPIYTNPTIFGLLLDWVATGLYGYKRPVLPAGRVQDIGAYGTGRVYGAPPPYGELRRIGPAPYYATNDDVYKRCLTWHFYKADGKYFSIRWLKRRVMRFLIGTNGTAPNIDQTYQIGVSFGPNYQANIIIYNGIRSTVSGPFGRRAAFGCGPAYGTARTRWTQLTPITFAPVFKAAVDAGALELPFQYSWVVTIIG